IRDINYKTQYYWRIRAINAVDTFEWSERKTFSTGGMHYSYISMGSGGNTTISYFHTLYSKGGHIQVDTSEDFSTILLDTLILRDTSQKSVYTSIIPYKNLIYGQRYYIRGRMYHAKDSADWVTRPVNIIPIGQLRYPYPDDIFEPGDSVVFDTSSYSGNYFRLQIDTTSDYSSPGLFDTVVLSSSPLIENIRPKVYYNKTYYWRLKIANEKDTSEWSDYKYARTFKTPSKPELSYPYNGTTLYTIISPSLRWVALDKANYRLQMDTAADFSSPVFTDTLITDFTGEFRVEDLYFKSKYHWRVRYENNGDFSQWSEPRYFNTADRVLNLEPRNGSVNAYPNDIDWRSIDGTIGYIIKIDTIKNLNSGYAHIDTVYQDKAFFYSFYLGNVELLFDQDYYCQVSLFNNVDTLLSDTNYFVTRSREAPIQVSPANGVKDQSFSVTLRWNSYTNAKAYLIEISEFADMRDSITVYQTGLSYKTNLEFGKDYYWRVRGMYDDLIVVSDYSVTWKFTVQDAISGPVLKTPLNEEKGVTLDTKLRWEKVAGATNYTVELSNSPDFIGLYRRTSVTNSYLYDVLAYNAKYYWRVRANVSGTASNWSEVRSFTTTPKTTSVTEENEIEVMVYPNPIRDFLRIEMNNTSAQAKDIVDLVGNVVYTIDQSDRGVNTLTDLSSLKSGVYLIRIEDKGVIYTKRIIKE
ncbi:MAG: T9SS type A sorting domain-containing protein, partial [Bacteroidia bacterium]